MAGLGQNNSVSRRAERKDEICLPHNNKENTA